LSAELTETHSFRLFFLAILSSGNPYKVDNNHNK